MIAKDSLCCKALIFNEFNDENNKYWFDFKQKKFLHNIDTFYYSVKLINDFTATGYDKDVARFRADFKVIYNRMNKGYASQEEIFINDERYNILNITYAHFYNICISCPDYFDIFIAPIVPPAAAGKESVTCEIVVQIRSYMLWMYGVHEAFERSYKVVVDLCNQYNLDIDHVQENRIDYCWHNNYFVKPESFFTIENIYKRRVDQYKDAIFHTAKVGSEDYEVDYVALGRRSGTIFLRIYNKTKEVIQQGYKPFFFKIWLFHGLINRYDFNIYEQSFVNGSWKYMTIARLNFYVQNGKDKKAIDECNLYISQYDKSKKVTDQMINLANKLTPVTNTIVNVEYQVMRKASKSFALLPLRDNSIKDKCKRIYDFLDNRKLEIDYLTKDIFRLVDLSEDTNKSRRNYCPFWSALRQTKIIDVTDCPNYLKLCRQTSTKLDKQRIKRKMINAACTYGIYNRGLNEDDPMKDLTLGLLMMNDNDIKQAKLDKIRKLKQLNNKELPCFDGNNIDISQYILVNSYTGLVYDDTNINEINCKYKNYFVNDQIQDGDNDE